MLRSKKILFVSHESSLTGAPRILFEIANYMNDFMDISIVSSASGTIESLYDIPVIHLEFTEVYIEDFLKKNQYDLIYINSTASFLWVQIAEKLSLKYIFHTHEKMPLNILESGINPNNILCVSHYCKDLSGLLPLKPDNLIYEFINTDFIDAYIGKPDVIPVQLDVNKKIILGVGRIIMRKGIDIFIDIARTMPEYQFLWIGIDKDKELLKDTPSNFFHINETTNPYYYMNKCDLFILTSRDDPFPLVVLEALYMNKPVVCFEQGNGSQEILNSCGYVLEGYPSMDSAKKFIQNYDFSLIHESNKMIKENFSNKVMLPKIKKIIENALC